MAHNKIPSLQATPTSVQSDGAQTFLETKAAMVADMFEEMRRLESQ